MNSGTITMQRNDTENMNQDIFRTTRMFQEDGSWFFKIREGETFGPFRDELEASTRLEVYIRLVDSGVLPA